MDRIIRHDFSFEFDSHIQDTYHYNLTGVRVIVLCPGLLDIPGATSSSHGNRFKSPIHEKAWQLDMKGAYPQKCVNNMNMYCRENIYA